MSGISGKDLAYRALASAIGGPVDLTTMVMRPFGYNVEKPVLGSEWIGQKMEQGGLISDARDPLKEFAASIMTPSPGGIAAGLGKSAALLPLVGGMTKIGKVEDALKAENFGLKYYAMGSSKDINAALRGEKVDWPPLGKAVSDLDTAVKQFAKPVSTTLFSGISGPHRAEVLRRLAGGELKRGSVIENKGFTSASESESVAQSFGSDRIRLSDGSIGLSDSVVYKIKPTPALSGVSVPESLSTSSEAEYLLDRGSKFKITDIARGDWSGSYAGSKATAGRDVIVIEVELVK